MKQSLVLGRSAFGGCVLARQETTFFYGKRSSVLGRQGRSERSETDRRRKEKRTSLLSLSNERRVA